MRLPYAYFETEIEVLSSRFIACLYPLGDPKEVDIYLEKTKEKYPKARHYPYAWRYLPFEGASDAGEPKGSTGLPLLETLRLSDVDRLLVVVVRYFGGTKLGLGRLTRTYRDVTERALKGMEEAVVVKRRLLHLEAPYPLAARLKKEALYKGISIEKEEYGLSVGLLLAGGAKMIEGLIEPYKKDLNIIEDKILERREKKDDSSK